MFTLVLALAVFTAPPPPPLAARRCEDHGPRLDGTTVTVCDGRVVRVRDGLGNVRRWQDDGRVIVLRSPGMTPVTIDRDGR